MMVKHPPHYEESAEVLDLHEFIEEFWPILIFGSFFLMTMFLPILFGHPNLQWLYWSFSIVVLIGLAILSPVVCTSLCKKKH